MGAGSEVFSAHPGEVRRGPRTRTALLAALPRQTDPHSPTSQVLLYLVEKRFQLVGAVASPELGRTDNVLEVTQEVSDKVPHTGPDRRIGRIESVGRIDVLPVQSLLHRIVVSGRRPKA